VCPNEEYVIYKTNDHTSRSIHHLRPHFHGLGRGLHSKVALPSSYVHDTLQQHLKNFIS